MTDRPRNRASGTQIWVTPGKAKAFAPMRLHRTYGGCFAEITTLAWAADGRYVAVGSADTTARVFSLDPVEGSALRPVATHTKRVDQ